MREGALPGQRPRLGRPKSEAESAPLPQPDPGPTVTRPVEPTSQNKLKGDAQIQTNPSSTEGVPEVKTNSPAKIQTRQRPVRSSRNPNPNYVGAIVATKSDG